MRTGTRAQTTIGFIIGFTLFVSAVALAVGATGGYFNASIASEADTTLDAAQIADRLIYDELQREDTTTPSRVFLDREATVVFFDNSTTPRPSNLSNPATGVNVTIRATGNRSLPSDMNGVNGTKTVGQTPTAAAETVSRTAVLDGDIVRIEVTTWPIV